MTAEKNRKRKGKERRINTHNLLAVEFYKVCPIQKFSIVKAITIIQTK